jgi:hypothetical protein
MMLLRDVKSLVFQCGDQFHIIHRGRVLPVVFFDRNKAHQTLGQLSFGRDAQQATNQGVTA